MSEIEALITARLTEIDEQLRPLFDERERLERALDELRPDDDEDDARRRRRRRRHGAAPRAAHGANVTAIFEHVELHPGATAGDVARATNISRGAIYSALSRMASAGRLRRETRPDGTVGYYVGDNESPASMLGSPE